MKKAYPIILEKLDKGYLAAVPDFVAFTQGDDMADTIAMARDLIGLTGLDLLDDGGILPEPGSVDIGGCDGVASYENHIGVVSYVDVDFDVYRRKLNNRSVRKNCTIPQWLADRADKIGVNYSRVLQEALVVNLNSVSQPMKILVRNLFDTLSEAVQKGDMQSFHFYLDQLASLLFDHDDDGDPIWPDLTKRYFKSGITVLFECFATAEQVLSLSLWDQLTLDLCYQFFVQVAPMQFISPRQSFGHKQYERAEALLNVDQLLSLGVWVDTSSDMLWDNRKSLDLVHLLQSCIDADADNQFKHTDGTLLSMLGTDTTFSKMVISSHGIALTKLGELVPDLTTAPICGKFDLSALLFWRLSQALYGFAGNDNIVCLTFDEINEMVETHYFAHHYFEKVFLGAYGLIDFDEKSEG